MVGVIDPPIKLQWLEFSTWQEMGTMRPLIVNITGQLLVFERSGHEDPRCVARLKRGGRCSMELERMDWGGWGRVIIAGADGSVGVLERGGAPDDCWIRQRCVNHLETVHPDVIAPEWVLFDAARHAAHIDSEWPLWTPGEGVRARRREMTPAIDGHVADAEYAERLADLLSRAAAAAAAEPARTTALYRYRDARERLLYIGISDAFLGRVASHIEGSSWMEFAASSTIARYPSRKDALDAEEVAIKTEHPLFNKQHNDTPEAKLRLVEYLIEQGRPDLLAPAISRG